MKPETSIHVELLQHPQSPKRRSAAIKLRKLGDPSAGPALLVALERELARVVTWETQYQMVRALGECGYRPALPLLRQLATTPLDATMIYVAVGDAVVRLARSSDGDAEPVLELLTATFHRFVPAGAIRACAMIPMKLSEEAAAEVLQRAERLLEGLDIFWAVLASAGWSGSAVTTFLNKHVMSSNGDIAKAARLAQQGKYMKVSPL